MTLNIVPAWQLEMFLERINQAVGLESVIDEVSLGYYMGLCDIPLTQINRDYLRFILNNIEEVVGISEDNKQ